MSTLRLYEIASAYQAIRALCADGGTEEEWAEALTQLEDQADAKLLAIGRIIREQEATQKGIAFELERLDARANAAANAEKRLKAYALESLTAMGRDKVADAVLSIVRQRNSQPSTVVPDTGLVSAEYLLGSVKAPWSDLPAELREKAELVIDKRRMLEDHKAGKDVPGASFEYGYHVRVR